jgi:PTS system N-acetylgalactosamine-specific IIA component
MFASTFRKMKSSPDETGEAQPLPRAIVAGHGDFPEGIVSAVDQISGCGGVFLAVSNRGLSGQDIETRLRSLAGDTKVSVFFTDLPGGSATLAVRHMMREDPEIMLITGANLATLLEFAFLSKDDLAAAARIAAEKGRAALGAYGGK